jgi:hypothetical protein
VAYESADLENAEAARAVGSPDFLRALDQAAKAATGGGKRSAWPSEFRPGEALGADILGRFAAEARAQCDLLRDVFGNPLRASPALDPAWLTTAVVPLATAAYDERTFDRMPILGDALEEVGCDDPEILEHCRGQGEHVRGCWVVDALLGKS